MKKLVVFNFNSILKTTGGTMPISDKTNSKTFLWRFRLIDE
jgi:hypothetical protein